MKISKYLTLEQATKSQTAERKGIDNTPDTEQRENMKHVAKNVYDKVVDEFPGTYLNSFFRGDKLNAAIGGSKTSQHRSGEAVDIDHATKNKQIFEYVRKNLEFDQLIWEFGDDTSPAWVHVSLRRDGKNRKQVLVAYSENGKTKYKAWQ
jgi:zinc D-Ala-D-Ala carboxypeptidase